MNAYFSHAEREKLNFKVKFAFPGDCHLASNRNITTMMILFSHHTLLT